MSIEINVDRFYERLERLQTDWMSKKSGSLSCLWFFREDSLCSTLFVPHRPALSIVEFAILFLSLSLSFCLSTSKLSLSLSFFLLSEVFPALYSFWSILSLVHDSCSHLLLHYCSLFTTLSLSYGTLQVFVEVPMRL